MIRMPKEPMWAKKGPMIALFCVLGLAILAVGGWFMLSVLMVTDYQQRVGSAQSDISMAISRAKGGFLVGQTNTAGMTIAQQLKNFGTELSAETAEFPNAPVLLGAQLIDDQQRLNNEVLRTRLVDLASVVNKTSQFLEYEQFIGEGLSKLNKQKGATLKELQTLEVDWRTFVNELAALSPPTDLKAAHKQIVDLMAGMYQTIAQLPAAFKSGSQLTFVTKQNELQAKLAGLNGMYDLFENLNKQQDKALAESLKAMEAALQSGQ